MNKQEKAGSVESEYLTIPELAKMVRRNRKTVYGWIESLERVADQPRDERGSGLNRAETHEFKRKDCLCI